MWAVPRTVVQRTDGLLKIVDVIFILSDDESAADDVIIGLPIMQNLGIETKKMLEKITTTSMVLFVSIINRLGETRKVGRPMIARLNCLPGDKQTKI